MAANGGYCVPRKTRGGRTTQITGLEKALGMSMLNRVLSCRVTSGRKQCLVEGRTMAAPSGFGVGFGAPSVQVHDFSPAITIFHVFSSFFTPFFSCKSLIFRRLGVLPAGSCTRTRFGNQETTRFQGELDTRRAGEVKKRGRKSTFSPNQYVVESILHELLRKTEI